PTMNGPQVKPEGSDGGNHNDARARRPSPFVIAGLVPAIHLSVRRPPALFVAIDLFAALVQFLRLQAQRGDGAGVEPGDADGLAGFLAIAVSALIDALERGVDL